MKKIPIICFLFAIFFSASAQTDTSQTQTTPKKRLFEAEEIPLIFNDTVASDKREKREKKIPKRVFYGLKTKKGYTKTSKFGKKTYELFYTLAEFKDPDPYVKDIYWFHARKKKLMVGQIPPKEKKFARVLHGPYIKQYQGKIVEEGIFYIGTKHGRWERYNGKEEELLVEKKKYYKGWPKEADVSYYDADRKQVKEVIPVEHGVLEGDYYYYYPSGQIAEHGKYENGRKIGIWQEFFDSKKKLKKETQYAADGFDDTFIPFTLIEYDVNGKLLYDKAAEDKKKAQEAATNPNTEKK